MKRVRVTFGGAVSSASVITEGATLAHAVRKAVRLLGLGAGKTVGKPARGEDGDWAWDWSGSLLRVHEIHQSGTPGMRTARADRARKPIELTLSHEARIALDTRAALAGTSRSAVVEAWLLASGRT